MARALTQHLRDGIAAAKAGDYERARTLLQPVADASPTDVIPWFWLAIASPSTGDAIACLRHVLEIDPAYDPARAALARLLITQAGAAASAGNRKEARGRAIEATELAPGSVATWLALASVTNDRAERLDALRRAFKIDSQPATRARLRQALLHGAVMVVDADPGEARAMFREAASLDPGDPHVWQALVQLSQTPHEALEVVREMLRAVPDHPDGAVLLKKALTADARALQTAGQEADACNRWREATQVDAGDMEAWLGLAQTTGDETEARRAVECAFAIDPTDARVTAAMAEHAEVTIDPSAFEAPADAFAHLEQPGDVFAGLDQIGEAPRIDLDADPFARFGGQAERPTPVPPAMPEDAPAPAVEIPPAREGPPSAEWAEPPVVETAAPEAERPQPVAETSPAAAPMPPAPIAPPASVVAPPAPLVPPSASEAAPQVSGVAPPPPAAMTPVPERATPVPAAPIFTPPARPAAAGFNGMRRTVMVVDDSPTIRKILGLTLERAGYKVVAEPDGESAMERLTQVVPDLILLDIAMPKLDGYEVCKRIRKDPRTARVPVVMLSGKDALFDKVKGHMAGATEYLTKPFETTAVLAVVSGAFQPASEAVDG